MLPLIYYILLLMSVNYPSYFTESLCCTIPAGRPFSEGVFILLVLVLSLIFCGVKNEDNMKINTEQQEPGIDESGRLSGDMQRKGLEWPSPLDMCSDGRTCTPRR